ncbi:MAG: hypothetical protein WCA20_29715 [Candidatus Sulfotelmatobacter sp.]
MAALRNFWTCCALCTVSFAFYSGQTFGQTNSNEGSTLKQSQNPNAQKKNVSGEQTSAAEDRDGQRDFDFLFGSWSVHNRRLLHPLTGSSTWVEFDGTAIDRPVWDGRANLEEFEADSHSGHIEGMTVRTYNTKSHQWSIYWANQSSGSFSLPATVGQFKDGRGEFYDQEEYNGKNIFVRYTWFSSPESPRWEQAFSADGGKTWETNWTWTLSRVRDESDKAH